MSTPINHHYVPKCLIKNFINSKGQYSCYDKIKNIHYYASSNKRIFSEKELNTIIDDEGNLNHSEIESQLNKKFESDFPKYYKVLEGLINDKDDEYLNVISKSGELKSALNYLIRLGLIGDFRNPNHKKNTDDIIVNSLKYAQSKIKLSENIEDFLIRRKKTKYISHIDFEVLVDGIIKHLGEYVFTIYVAPENEFFLLPDCQSIYRRDVLEDDILYNGEFQKSMCNVISMLGYPINSRIFLSIESKKISIEKFDRIKRLDRKSIFYINCNLFSSAYKTILCENEAYLKILVDKIIRYNKIVSNP